MERETPKIKRTKVEECVTDEGLLVSGIGILSKQLDKIIEKLEKIDRKLYFMEDRDKKRFEQKA